MRAISLLFHDVYETSPDESGFVSAAADRYKLPLADFDQQLEGVAQVRSDAPAVVAGSASRHPAHTAPDPTVWGGSRGADPPFLITVDDGGVAYHTLMADHLERRGWRGHCFVSTDLIGRRGFLDAAQIRELDARGHVIGTHSASHPARFSALPVEAMVREWASSRTVLEGILGHDVTVASVPGGYFSPTVARAAATAGIRVLFTSEPVTSIHAVAGCTVIGRFTIRRGDPADAAQRLVIPAPWARSTAWVTWNAKGLVKPLLGPSYRRIADWVFS
jgi:peptidoglycan/xylan/chitin deacetylase (PgdA/CDA1 family)